MTTYYDRLYCLSETGNELSGSGIGARVDANLYATDIIKLSKILKEIYNHSHEKPLLVAPDGFFDPSWFQAILQETGPNVLNAVTRHIYNLGAGRLDRQIPLVFSFILICTFGLK